jgi:hypothetical protein
MRWSEACRVARRQRDDAICDMRMAGAYLDEIAGVAGMARSNVSKILRRNGLR